MPSHLSIAQMVFAVKISICELFFFSSQMIIKNILGKIVTTFNTYLKKKNNDDYKLPPNMFFLRD